MTCPKCGGGGWMIPVYVIQIFVGQEWQRVEAPPIQCAACRGTGGQVTVSQTTTTQRSARP